MFWEEKRIYMDYAGGTPICGEARHAMQKTESFAGNPGAIHADGVQAKEVLENARKEVGLFLGCRAREVVFTSGGTESNNLAILGFARSIENEKGTLNGTHWITSSIEHPSVLECFKEIERKGAQVTYIQPDEHGTVRVSDVHMMMREETVFVSVGWANSEIGAVQLLHGLSKMIREHERIHDSRVVFHTDAGQAPLYLPSMVHGLGADLLSLDSGKLYGPRGIGVLYIKSDVTLAPIMRGGSQERGLRPGSESIVLSVGFAAALRSAAHMRKEESERLSKLRSKFVKEISSIHGSIVNGSAKKTLPNIVNVSVPHISSEYITLALDRRGVAISTKSACREGEEEESHVVKALGGEAWRAKNTLRFSFGRATSEQDVVRATRKLAETIEHFAELDRR